MMETKISDLQLAAYLLSLNYPLLRVEGVKNRRVFVYGKVPENMTLTYYQGADKTSARKLFAAYRDLRDVLTQE